MNAQVEVTEPTKRPRTLPAHWQKVSGMPVSFSTTKAQLDEFGHVDPFGGPVNFEWAEAFTSTDGDVSHWVIKAPSFVLHVVNI